MSASPAVIGCPGGGGWGACPVCVLRVTNSTKHSSLHFFNTSITSTVNVTWHQTQQGGDGSAPSGGIEAHQPHPLQEDSDPTLTRLHSGRILSPVGLSAEEVHAGTFGRVEVVVVVVGGAMSFLPPGETALKVKAAPVS